MSGINVQSLLKGKPRVSSNEPGETQEKEGYIALLVSAIAFSLMSVCVKKLGDKIPTSEIVFFRGILCLLITIIQLKLNNINPWGGNKILLLIRGVLGTLALYCVFRALGNLSIASATVIQYTYPTFTALGAWAILKEKLNERITLSIILGWIGIYLVAQPEWERSISYRFSLVEISIAILGAILTSLAYLCVRKLSSSEESLVIIFYFPLVSVILTLPIIITNYVAVEIEDYIWILGVALFTQIGQISITKGLKLLPASKACSINYIQVIFASVWGLLIFSEKINIYTASGAILVFCSCLTTIQKTRME